MFYRYVEAFDWVDKDMQTLYNHPLSKVKVNTYTTRWFTTESGIRQ